MTSTLGSFLFIIFTPQTKEDKMVHRYLASIILTGFLVCLAGGTAVGEEAISIGAPLPLTGPYASDGEQMKMAVDLAVEEINSAGGLLGRKLKVTYGDVNNLEPEKVKAVGERLIGAGIDLAITGYDSTGAANVKVYGQSEIPYLHGNAKSECTQAVANNPIKYGNVFQYTYNEKEYGGETIKTFLSVPQKIGWAPPNQKIAVITVDYPYSSVPAADFAKLAEKMGYQVVINETVPFNMIEWSPILSKIERTQPSFITFWHVVPADSARFMNQFVERFADDGIDALLHMQYTPSIPEFLELAGENANGLIWVGGFMEAGDKYEAYKQRWVAKFKKDPVGLYSVATRDAFDMWVQAVMRAGCVECYSEINRLMRESVYTGIAASIVFHPQDQSAIAGEYLYPMGWYQVQNGGHVPISPVRFAAGKYQKPPWLKK